MYTNSPPVTQGCYSLVLSVSGIGLGFEALVLAFNILALMWITRQHDNNIYCILVCCVMKLFIRAPASSAPMERVISHGGLLVLNLTEPGYLTRCWNHLLSLLESMIRMGVSGWMFLLVPAYPGCPGSKAVKRSLLLLLLESLVFWQCNTSYW